MFPPPRRPIQPTNALDFDQDEIRRVAAIPGHRLCLCRRMVVAATNYELGMPQREAMVCTDQIFGYVSVKRMSEIQVNPNDTGRIYRSELIANIIPDNFQASKIDKDTRLLYKEVYYQLESINEPANSDRGVILLYQYRLHNPSKLVVEGPQQKPRMISVADFFKD